MQLATELGKHDRLKLRVFQFNKKNLSSPLKLGRPPVSQEREERIIYRTIQTNIAYKNCNWLASKTWSIQATIFLPLKKISLHLLNLGAPPVSQDGEEGIIY